MLSPTNLDLAFLFADPLVSKNEHGETFEYIVPLDLEAEYSMIVSALTKTNRRFAICHESMSYNRLQMIASR
jgi:hypothetical protein